MKKYSTKSKLAFKLNLDNQKTSKIIKEIYVPSLEFYLSNK